uniref:Serine/threonine-protein kinase receptor n=1 Tax=Ephydatia fluviatilis TaxID=31330 RepID=Q9UAF9_9METZ|nr:sALK-7 [Ephydatia fluviatilis]
MSLHHRVAPVKMRPVIALLTMLTAAARAGNFSCYCNECSDGNTCTIDTSSSSKFRCQTDIHTTLNGSYIRTVHSCATLLLDACVEYYRAETLVVYTLCCTTDQCNRCGLPSTLPPALQSLVPRPPGCPPIPPFLATATPTGTLETTLVTDVVNSSEVTQFNIIIAALVVVTVLISLLAAIVIGAGIMLRRKKMMVAVDDIKSLEASSGHGDSKMEQKTIVDEIRRVKHIGNGRFGRVWLGEWRGEKVAVKVFETKDTESWEHEQKIYHTKMLHHENILNCVTCSMWSSLSSHTELWMILEYHENGSLYDYLTNHTLSTPEALRFLTSIISGLCHLHTEIRADNESKPGIAHRDLKSKNILVKRDMTCCLADFGLAICQDLTRQSCVEKIPPHPHQGTKRYMAPEILDGSINGSSFSAYKQADMYALSLVMWEILQRCEIEGKPLEYTVPYQAHVPHDPSVEEMKVVVVLREIRPELEERWNRNEVLAIISSQMQECWRANPHARLTIARVKKSLQQLTQAPHNKDDWM